MGQKTNPIGLRIAVNHDWRSKWYAGKKEFGKLLTEDRQIRALLKKKLEPASVPQILIERAASRCRITIMTARPGIVIGRKGAEIDKLKEELSLMTGKEIYVDILEVKTPEIDAQLVAENVALQLERRVSFRRAMKKALQTAKDFGAEGIKIRCAGRLGGAELARVEVNAHTAAHDYVVVRTQLQKQAGHAVRRSHGGRTRGRAATLVETGLDGVIAQPHLGPRGLLIHQHRRHFPKPLPFQDQRSYLRQNLVALSEFPVRGCEPVDPKRRVADAVIPAGRGDG